MLEKKLTLSALKGKKGKEKIAAITAYDALMASIFDGEVDVILVGDSLKMSFGGENSTLSASISEMIYHARAVSSATQKSFLIADMPFGSYDTKENALKNALRFYKKCEIDALKLEVGSNKSEIVRALCNEGIAVMAHIGLKPQFMRFEGGFKVKGRNELEARELIDVAKEMEQAGVFGLLIEGVSASVGAQITQAVGVPTIGIGAGGGCDGQIMVWSDAFGFFDKFKPKFVRRYFNGKEALQNALREYVQDVKSGNFPSEAESY